MSKTFCVAVLGMLLALTTTVAALASGAGPDGYLYVATPPARILSFDLNHPKRRERLLRQPVRGLTYLEDIVPVAKGEFFAKDRYRLVHFSIAGTTRVILGENVMSFSYNKRKRLIVAIHSTGLGQKSIKVITWPKLTVNTLPLDEHLLGAVNITSQGERVLIGTLSDDLEGRIYAAKVGEYTFSPLVNGLEPTLDDSGEMTAFIDGWQHRRLCVLDNRSGKVAKYETDSIWWRLVGAIYSDAPEVHEKAWIGHRWVAFFHHSASTVFPIPFRPEVSLLDVRTGRVSSLFKVLPGDTPYGDPAWAKW